MKVNWQKNTYDRLFPIVILHNKSSVSWEMMEEALLLMRKHLIVKYGHCDSQYVPAHRGIHKDSLRAQKNTLAFE